MPADRRASGTLHKVIDKTRHLRRDQPIATPPSFPLNSIPNPNQATSMAPSVLYPPSQLSPAGALALSQQAPAILRSSASTVSSSPLVSLLKGSEKSDLWLQYENLILSCLRTGDDLAANACLRRLANRFGNDNERVQALKGLVKEAEAKNNGELEAVLNEYNQILGDNETNIVRPRPPPRCCCVSGWLTRVPACRKEAGRALAVHGSPTRRGVSSRAAPRLLADRFRSLV